MPDPLSASPIVASIRADLRSAADPIRAKSTERFFKHPVHCYGLPVPDTRLLGKKHLTRLKNQPPALIWEICDALWSSGVMEESIIACQYSYSLRKSFQPADLKRFKRWLANDVNNWASCDTLCNHTIGDFLQAYPQYLTELKKWTRSRNRWLRRAAAVSLIIPAARGQFLTDCFEIAELLLQDEDDLVQKGYGWMLKSASVAYPEKVFKFIMRHRATMPRTALRYAIEKLDPESRKKAMQRSTN